jgi:hypothetical protein
MNPDLDNLPEFNDYSMSLRQLEEHGIMKRIEIIEEVSVGAQIFITIYGDEHEKGVGIRRIRYHGLQGNRDIFSACAKSNLRLRQGLFS